MAEIEKVTSGSIQFSESECPKSPWAYTGYTTSVHSNKVDLSFMSHIETLISSALNLNFESYKHGFYYHLSRTCMFQKTLWASSLHLFVTWNDQDIYQTFVTFYRLFFKFGSYLCSIKSMASCYKNNDFLFETKNCLLAGKKVAPLTCGKKVTFFL